MIKPTFAAFMLAAGLFTPAAPVLSHDSLFEVFSSRGACEARLAQENQVDMRIYKDLAKEFAGNAGDVNRFNHYFLSCVQVGTREWQMVVREG